MGEDQGKQKLKQARQTLVQRLEKQTRRNYRKSKSFDEIRGQEEAKSISEQNSTGQE